MTELEDDELHTVYERALKLDYDDMLDCGTLKAARAVQMMISTPGFATKRMGSVIVRVRVYHECE